MIYSPKIILNTILFIFSYELIMIFFKSSGNKILSEIIISTCFFNFLIIFTLTNLLSQYTKYANLLMCLYLILNIFVFSVFVYYTIFFINYFNYKIVIDTVILIANFVSTLFVLIIFVGNNFDLSIKDNEEINKDLCVVTIDKPLPIYKV